MDLYHVLMGTTDTNALNIFPDKSLNVLFAASMQTFDKRWKGNLPLIHKKKKSLYSDSGMIGWIKKLEGKAWEYASDPKLVLDIQLRTDPDIIAHLDIPCEPHILRLLGKTRDQAMDQTVENAKWIIDQGSGQIPGKIPRNLRIVHKKIAIGVQGWTIDDYARSINKYRKLGFMDLDPNKYMFAIGSVCMRKPPDLYEVAQLIRDRIPERFNIHCYGIANLPWILQLRQMGITSCDSATASIAAAYFRLIDEGGRRGKIDIRNFDTFMKNSLFAFNIASLEYQLRNNLMPTMDELFFDESYQMDLENI